MNESKKQVSKSNSQLKFLLPSIYKKGDRHSVRKNVSVLDPTLDKTAVNNLSLIGSPSDNNMSKMDQAHRVIGGITSLGSTDGIKHLAKAISQKIFDKNGEIEVKIRLTIKMIDMALDNVKAKQTEGVVLIMEEIESSCLSFQIHEMVLGFYKTFMICLLELSEYQKCTQIAKKLLTETQRMECYPEMIICYEKAGAAFLKLSNLEEALKCFFMMLKVSLRVKNNIKELTAYDRIGFVYFNLNQLDKSEYFHTKMLECKIEPNSSDLRKLQVMKHKVSMYEKAAKYNFGDQFVEEDVNELEETFFEPMAVDPKYRGFDDRQKKAIDYLDKKHNATRRVGNVRVFSNSPDMEKIIKGNFTKKPTNNPVSNLAHLSGNRSIRVYDSISGKSSKNSFRFLQYGKEIKLKNRNTILSSLKDYKNLLESLITRIVKLD